MLFTKAALVAALLSVATTGWAAGQKSEKPQAQTGKQMPVIVPMLAPKDKVLGYTDEGIPITEFKRSAVNAGKELAGVMLRAREKAEKEGRIPKQKIKTWDDMSRETEEYVKKHGPITTKNFIIPGTTPQMSREIHDEKSGMKVCGTNGDMKACLITPEREGEAIQLQKAVPQSGDYQAAKVQKPNESQSPFTIRENRERIALEDVPPHLRPKTSVKPNVSDRQRAEDLSLPAEERYRLYFKDEQPVSLLEGLMDWMIPSATAAEIYFNENELKAMRAAKETIRKEMEGKKLTDVIGETKSEAEKKAIAEKMIQEAQKVREAHEKVVETAVIQKLKETTPKELLEAIEPEERTLTFVFVSYSLTDDVILDILKRNAGRDDVTMVMRGVPEGANLANGLKRMQDLARQVTPEPNILLDPTLFSRFDIKAVPTVVRAKSIGSLVPETPEKRNELSLIAKVEGLHNDDWLRERIERGETGYLGQQGPIYEIAERDLIEVIKERVMAIDWGAKKEAAIKRYWDNQSFIELPQAAKTETKEVDPSVIVTQDMTDSEGNVIHKAGTRINPLDLMPFTSEVIVFNPTREEEKALIDEHLKAVKNEPWKKRIFIATAINKEKGWDEYKALTDWLDAPLYLLTPEIKSRFMLEATPSLVTADHSVFVVKTLAKEKADDKH